ncbi:multicopper oxidase family protein [Nocardia transvalensis]|uniref:multicopper oxidase family protein n=1 Tax=Nocardia transvalensis TaxID=37333 RepID=UPI001894A58C|nr:multicopper oxidase domain-containing protein [Nocardia transvalensis]MBF6328270.1 multicopper oxidase domain-containing protein [Nocardia transvalensis]
MSIRPEAPTGSAAEEPAVVTVVEPTADDVPVTPPPFQVEMPIPNVLTPVRSTETTDYYCMEVSHSDVEILPGKKTSVMAFNGEFPGPTIRTRSNRETVVTQTNSVHHPISIHLHGAVVDPASDGTPMDTIDPGDSRDYIYGNKQVAASLWYHDHAHHMEAEHVYRGMAGMYLISDDHERSLGLPDNEFDVPLVIRDVGINKDGVLIYKNDFTTRPTILVNGKPQPYFRVAARKYRFRILNGSNLRPMSFRLSNGAQFTQIATDRGLLPAPFRTTDLPLSPGERAEVVVDFSQEPIGSSVILENTFLPTETTRQIMRFDVVCTAPDPSKVPDTLATLPPMGTSTVTRDFQLFMNHDEGLHLINGRSYDPERVDAAIVWGSSEIWRITAAGDPVPHNFHLHLVDFRVLDVNGVPPNPGQAGLKDTVPVMLGDTVRILVRFDFPYSGIYPYHCHLIEHSALGMMAQLEILYQDQDQGNHDHPAGA